MANGLHISSPALPQVVNQFNALSCSTDITSLKSYMVLLVFSGPGRCNLLGDTMVGLGLAPITLLSQPYLNDFDRRRQIERSKEYKVEFACYSLYFSEHCICLRL